MKASPAAAAAVSRALSDADVRRAVEIKKGVELEGYHASPCGDHVRVEYVADPWSDDAEVVASGLARCEMALLAKGYAVERRVVPVAHPGEWRDGDVLEVRRGEA